MNLIHIGFVLLIVTAFSSQALAQTSTATSPGTQLKIGYVEVGIGGCGCSLALNADDLRKGRYVFIQDDGEPAYINLDGKDLKLEEVDSGGSQAVIEKVGDRSWIAYVAGDVKVRIDRTVTQVCDPKDESCEVTYYKVILTVSRKTQRTTIRTIGLCGC
ncbi:MAG TPA: hypothetical protein VG324_04540 [Blastocatellia bacterium]|nr:hypothetical protein [Blastocatellia bacterium]